MNEYLIVFIRIISIMALLLFCTLFIMGKRPIGELPVFDFLSIIVMGAIVGADIADPKIHHLPTAFAVVVLALVQKLISYISVKSKRFRKLITFEPTVVAHNGELLYKNIEKSSDTVDEVLMLLREKEVFDLNKLGYAIIEPNGNLSVLKKSQHETLTPKMMNISTQENSLHTIVISEGNLENEKIKRTNFSEKHIIEKLKQQGYEDIKNIFFASIDEAGTMNISPYTEVDIIIE